jgi:FixJ family two-component response regulator
VGAAPHAPVVLMTGAGRRAASELVDLPGVAGLLAKPFDVAELLAAVEGAAGTR